MEGSRPSSVPESVSRRSNAGSVAEATRALKFVVTPLVTLATGVVAEHFSQIKVLDALPDALRRDVEKQLSLTHPLEEAVKYIQDGEYWKARAYDRWKACNVQEHGSSWKQLYVERNLADAIRALHDGVSDEGLDDVRRTASFSARFLNGLVVEEFPTGVDIGQLMDFAHLSMTTLSLTYNKNNVGMAYQKLGRGMLLPDCKFLAKALERTETLTVLRLTANDLDDERVRMLATGISDNITLTELDLSCNKIADRGARSLAKLLGNSSNIAKLVLADNHIHQEGGRALAKALRMNRSLIHLNLRLNRVEDDGSRAIFDSLRNNNTLKELNLSANSISKQGISSCAAMLYMNHSLESLDIGGNHGLNDEIGRLLRESIDHNKGLRKFDATLCDIGDDSLDGINFLLAAKQPPSVFVSA